MIPVEYASKNRGGGQKRTDGVLNDRRFSHLASGERIFRKKRGRGGAGTLKVKVQREDRSTSNTRYLKEKT